MTASRFLRRRGTTGVSALRSNLKGHDRSWRARVRSIAIESHQELLLRVPLQQTPSRVSLCCFSFSFSSFLALLATDRPCLSLLSRSPIYFLESDLIFFLGPMRVHVLTRNYLQKILGRAMNYWACSSPSLGGEGMSIPSGSGS